MEESGKRGMIRAKRALGQGPSELGFGTDGVVGIDIDKAASQTGALRPCALSAQLRGGAADPDSCGFAQGRLFAAQKKLAQNASAQPR
jgi:hypothetical protein